MEEDVIGLKKGGGVYRKGARGCREGVTWSADVYLSQTSVLSFLLTTTTFEVTCYPEDPS